MTVFIAVLNFLLSTIRLLYCAKNKRLMSVIWFLIAYFSFFFIPVSFESSITHYRGFSGDSIIITKADIFKSILYVFIFNSLFFLTEWSVWKLIRIKINRDKWVFNRKNRYLRKLQFIYGLILIVSSIVYGITTQDHSYKDFIEYTGSNWGQVFLMASAPLLSISALRKQYLLAFLGVIPFVFFAVKLHVRSFALLSFIPIVIIYTLQAINDRGSNGLKKVKKLLFSMIMILSLIGLSSWIIASKRGDENFNILNVFPDSGMPYGTVMVMKLSDIHHVRTGFDSIYLYGLNLITPFRKVFQLPPPEIIDPPFVMSSLLDGIPKWWKNNLHYPTLWYSDAYLSFGMLGLFFSVFWGMVLVFWERLLMKNIFIFSLLIPYFSWHAYMLVRGAISGAVVPFSYSVYLVFLVAMLSSFSKFRKNLFE